MVLGAVAAQAAKDGFDMSGPEAFARFHSGKFRFLDGLPVTPDGRLTFPLPLSIHRRKGREAMSGPALGPKTYAILQSRLWNVTDGFREAPSAGGNWCWT